MVSGKCGNSRTQHQREVYLGSLERIVLRNAIHIVLADVPMPGP